MSSGKIIKINPALFELTKRTKKNRPEKQNISIPKPKITTSAIKRKLLNRIKQKKTEENKINNQKKIPKINYSDSDDFNNLDELDELDDIKKVLNEEDEVDDELSNAMNYFDTMSIREKEKQKILNKTYKNRNLNNLPSNNKSLNNLSLNIPYQLTSPENNRINTITNDILDDLPYGCLKNGTKPTYKTWMNSIKNYSSMADTDKIDSIRPPTPPKKRQEDKINIFTENEYKKSLLEEPDKHKENILKKQINDRLKKIETEQHDMLKEVDDDVDPTLGEKQYVKKIIKRKYTLGKSPKYRKVGILIKGRQTKKNIINSHKKLKHTDIYQIKKYLKKCGMLKTGSSCPDEILRKMYESAMLSGEINNINKNTLIHNFLNDDEIIK